MGNELSKRDDHKVRELYTVLLKYEAVRNRKVKTQILLNKDIDTAMKAINHFVKKSDARTATERRDLAYQVLYFTDVNHAERIQKSGEHRSRIENIEFWERGTEFLEMIYHENNLVPGDFNKSADVKKLFDWLKSELGELKKTKTATLAQIGKRGHALSSLDEAVYDITEALRKHGMKLEPALLFLDEVLTKVFIAGLRKKGGYENTLKSYKKGKKKNKLGRERSRVW